MPLIGFDTVRNEVVAETKMLKVEGLENRWYTKRPMAPFQVNLCKKSGELAEDSLGVFVSVHLLSPHGSLLDAYLTHPGGLIFPVENGIAVVTGLKFTAVSSRHGGNFKLKFVVSGLDGVEPVSEDIQVLSERLKSESKADTLLDLCAEDPLYRVPGIGKKYASKLSEQGLVTVRDLADVDMSPAARPKRLEILNAVRRDRGALTEAKLVEMLRDARAVVKREREDEMDTEPAPKRRCDSAAPFLIKVPQQADMESFNRFTPMEMFNSRIFEVL